jgi:deferrochelatase/peroxidase EfeB
VPRRAALLPARHARRDDSTHSIPFFGRHRAGIATPPQTAAAFLSFDVTAGDHRELTDLLRTLTERAAFLTYGLASRKPADLETMRAFATTTSTRRSPTASPSSSHGPRAGGSAPRPRQPAGGYIGAGPVAQLVRAADS